MKTKRFKRLSLLIVLVCISALLRIQAQDASLKIHYTFDDVTNKIVPDQSGSGNDGFLMNNASVIAMGKYNVLSLGNGSGYVDMRAKSGEVLSATNSYTVSMYYRVDENASLNGAGYFLWSFSSMEACSGTSGAYAAYRLNNQRFAGTTNGYTNEQGIEVGNSAKKGVWQHVLYRQSLGTGRLYVDGLLIGTNTNIPRPGNTFPTPPKFNWIGRPPFSGDNYLRNTLVYDFRVYNKSLGDADIAALAGVVEELNHEYQYGSVGDFTSLSNYIQSCKSYLATINSQEYPPLAIEEFKDAIAYAQQLVDEQAISQPSINAQLALLTASRSAFDRTKGFKFEAGSPTTGYNTARGFKHPGALHTQEDFDRVKAQLAANDPTIVAAYQVLKNNQFSQSTTGTATSEKIVRGGGAGEPENYINAARGAHTAYMNALRWKIEGSKAHADNAVRVLNAWAAVCKEVTGDSNFALASGLYGYAFANAAELMRDYEGWDPKDFATFQRWMLEVWYPKCIAFMRVRNGTWSGGCPGHYWSNWGICNTLALMSIGILCDDVFIYNQGLSFYKHDQVGSFTDNRTPPVRNDGLTEYIGNLVPVLHEDARGPFGYLGQMQESGRDQGHAVMAAGLAVDICQVGWNQGDDLFSLMDNRLAKGLEYVAAYNTGVDDLPWMEYWYRDVRSADHNSWKQDVIGSGGRGTFRPYLGRLIGHYEGIKGVSMPFSHDLKDKLPIDGGGAGSTSGGYDHLGFSVLMCSRPSVLGQPEKVPTLIIPTLLYEGKIYQQNELGGLKNTYQNTHTSSAIPAGSTIKLIPTLPDDVTDTGNWKWESGETTKDLEVTVESSALYRVVYTNEKGVESTQVYSIAIEGDCNADVLRPAIVSGGVTINDTIITVRRGSSLNLTAGCLAGELNLGSFQWNNGSTSQKIEVGNIMSDRVYSVIFTNQGGRSMLLNFHIYVSDAIKSLANGDYYVKDPENNTYLTNDGLSLVPTFREKNDTELSTQSWTITKEGTRHKIVSALDQRFLKAGMFTNDTYSAIRDTYTFYGQEEETEDNQLYAIRNSSNAGSKYWTIEAGRINGEGVIDLTGYPFEIVPVGTTSIPSVVSKGFLVYPNPAKDYLIVQIDECEESGTRFMLYSVEGRIMKTTLCRAGKNIIPLHDLPRGLYAGIMDSDNKERSVRIVKE